MSSRRESLKERSARRRELLAQQLGAGCGKNLGLLLGNDKTPTTSGSSAEVSENVYPLNILIIRLINI